MVGGGGGGGGGLAAVVVVLVVVVVVVGVVVDVDEVVLVLGLVVGVVVTGGALVSVTGVVAGGVDAAVLVDVALVGAALDDTAPSVVASEEHPAIAVRPATAPTTVRIRRLRIRTA